MARWAAVEGAPRPLGATWLEDQQAWNFALYSRHGTAVTLRLFGDDASAALFELRLDPARNKSGRVWHCRVPHAAAPAARAYSYRVEGPPRGTEGAWFDPDKELLDPYARGVRFPPGFRRAAAIGPGSNTGQAPLGILPRPRAAFDWGDDRRPRHDADAVIYEAHLRGFTRHPSSGVPAARRGTYSGFIDRIPHLRELGVTVVELMPVQQFDPGDGNYWGYMPLSFFSPHQAYSQGGDPEAAFDEFRTLVKALHEADIEVVLDVVYNHTAEAGADGPLYGLRGIDNGTYYLLDPKTWQYRNDTGTGNVLRCEHPAVRSLVLDSLRFWVREMHVDGFRFDLASIFTRNADGSVNLGDPAIISEISNDPDFAGIRLIAESWDLAAYQLGRSFPGITWMQWNGRFRDDLRSAVKSDAGMVPSLMMRLYGSDDLFPDTLADAYRPWQSVNVVTTHDGFNLHDLVAYQRKHNEANGQGNRDGPDDNRSWNCGWEGEDGAPAETLALRRRQAKNFCALLLLANGTPMLVAGDEFLHTQRGNNNPFNQDNETTWLDWGRLAANADVFRFWKLMIAFRKAHPSLARSRFWRSEVRWYGTGATPYLSPESRRLALCVHGGSEGDDDLYLMINLHWEAAVFRVQEGAAAAWRRVVDTSLPAPDDIAEPGSEPALAAPDYALGPRSVVVLRRLRAP